RSDREVAILLRNLLDRHVEAVLLEEARFLGQGERREAGPARDADRDLGVLRLRGGGEERGAGEREEVLLHETYLSRKWNRKSGRVPERRQAGKGSQDARQRAVLHQRGRRLDVGRQIAVGRHRRAALAQQRVRRL